MKISRYLVKLWARDWCLVFFDSRCIMPRGSACRNSACRNNSCRNTACRNTVCRNSACRNNACRNTACRNSAMYPSYSAIFFGGGVLEKGYSRDARTDFDAKYVKRRSSAQGSAFLGSRNQNRRLRPPFPPKPPFLGPISDLEFFSPKTALTLDGSRVNVKTVRNINVLSIY